MAFWNNLINGLKGRQTQVPTQQTPIEGSIQNQSHLEQQVPDQVQEQAKTNAVVNALKNLAPSNWDDTTRQRVLMTSKFLSGFGGTQEDPNQSLMGNIARGVANGSNAAYKQIQNYNNYQQAKNMYNQMGLDSSTLNPLADYSSLTADKFINLGVQQRKQQMATEIANAKDNTTRLKLIMDGHKYGAFPTDETLKLMKIYGFDIDELEESNQTKRTNSQIKLNDARVNKLNKEAQHVGKPKVNISIKEGNTTSTVKHINSNISGEKKDELIGVNNKQKQPPKSIRQGDTKSIVKRF